MQKVSSNDVTSLGSMLVKAFNGISQDYSETGSTSDESEARGSELQGREGPASEGDFRNRIGNRVEPTPKTYEQSLDPEKYAYATADKYGINLRGSGQKIMLQFDPEIVSEGKIAKADPTVIRLGQKAFKSEEELARTISHELNHARSYLRGGDAPEATAYAAENMLGSYINGER